MQEDRARFLSRFKFDKRKGGFVGIEREHFLAIGDNLVPIAKDFLEARKDNRWTYELSACQAEVRTRPKQSQDAVKLELLENWNNGQARAAGIGVILINQEVGPSNMPLTVYPDPRYLEIVAQISQERLAAACRVTGTHIHLGMRSMDEAIDCYNALIFSLEYLSILGDHSGGERLRLYKLMAKNWEPPHYRDINHFLEVARINGFDNNPRNCWHLVRISKHGTVELRMFGVTDYVDEIIYWISSIKELISLRNF